MEIDVQVHNGAEVGVDSRRLARLRASVEKDMAEMRCDGGVFVVARYGKIVLHDAIGLSDRKAERQTRHDDVFSIMSVSKPMATMLVLQCVERGEIQFATPVCELIPELGSKGKQRITIGQLLSHTAGIASFSLPMETMVSLEKSVAAMSKLAPTAIPGKTVGYSSFASHSILGEVVRRLDPQKRRYRDILRDELFAPLGMTDSSLGQNPDRESRRVPIALRDEREGRTGPEIWESLNVLLREGAELPAAGVYSTALDVHRFAEMLRRGGELNGARIISPVTLDFATTNMTGDAPSDQLAFACEMRGWDPFPANLGLGFFIRGHGMYISNHGSLASPRTFGHPGAGSAFFWVDPVRQMTFVGLTAGLMEQSYSMLRWQRLSDIALASIVER